MGNVIDNAVKLINSEESLQDLCANFLGTDEDGKPWLDFRKVDPFPDSLHAIIKQEAVIRGRSSDTPERVIQEDQQLLQSKYAQFKTETDCDNGRQWCVAHYGTNFWWDFSFPSPDIMRFYSNIGPADTGIHSLAVLIKKPLRISWMDMQATYCGWRSCEPDGEYSSGFYSFESGLAPKWLWADLGCGDGSWVPEFLEDLSGRPPRNE